MTVKLHGHAELSQYKILHLFVIQYNLESRNINIDRCFILFEFDFPSPFWGKTKSAEGWFSCGFLFTPDLVLPQERWFSYGFLFTPYLVLPQSPFPRQETYLVVNVSIKMRFYLLYFCSFIFVYICIYFMILASK